MVNTYVTRDMLLRDTSDVVYLTYAMTDLTAFDPVTLAVEDFAAFINENPAIYSSLIGEARAEAYTYTKFIGYASRIDLGTFMNAMT